MPAPLTIVIPTLNAAGALPDTAAALLPGVTSGLVAGLIISDGGSEDATHSIAKDLGAELIQGPKGRGGQIARGVAAAATDWVLILHADTQLAPGWPDTASNHMSVHPETAGYFHLRFRADGIWPRLVEAGANWRSKALGLPYGDQGLLIRRQLLDQIGGIPDVPLMEDVILAGRLRSKLRPLGLPAETSADRYEAAGWARRVARNLWTLARFKLGVSPETLARKY